MDGLFQAYVSEMCDPNSTAWVDETIIQLSSELLDIEISVENENGVVTKYGSGDSKVSFLNKKSHYYFKSNIE